MGTTAVAWGRDNSTVLSRGSSCEFADYQLLVYGSLTFDEAYVKRARALVVELGLEDNVELRGLGKPTDVLSRGWCYLQVTSVV